MKVTYTRPVMDVAGSWLCCGMDLAYHRLEDLVPLSLAPNAITLGGCVQFLLCSLAFFTLLPYGHALICGLLCASVAVYIACDGVDGVHARRIGCACALGDMLDNGSDTVFVVFASTLLVKVLGVSLSSTLGVIAGTVGPWSAVTSTWATLHTGEDQGEDSLLQAEIACLCIFGVSATNQYIWSLIVAGIPLGPAILVALVIVLSGWQIIMDIRRVKNLCRSSYISELWALSAQLVWSVLWLLLIKVHGWSLVITNGCLSVLCAVHFIDKRLHAKIEPKGITCLHFLLVAVLWLFTSLALLLWMGHRGAEGLFIDVAPFAVVGVTLCLCLSGVSLAVRQLCVECNCPLLQVPAWATKKH